MSWTEDMKSAAAGVATGGIIGAASSVASGIFANRQQKKLLEIQQNFQRSEREASQRWQEDQWRAQTLYNSPIATMNRFREAGLSPDMMYQNGSISAMMSGSMPSAPSGSAPSVPTPAGTASYNQAAEQATQVAKNVAEVKNIESNTNKQNQEISNLRTINILDNKEIVIKDFFISQHPDKARELKLSLEAMDNDNKLRQKALEQYHLDIESKKISNEEARLNLKRSIETFSDSIQEIKLRNRDLFNKCNLDEHQISWFNRFKQKEYEILCLSKNQDELMFNLNRLNVDMRESLEKDLGKEKGFILKRLIDLDYSMKVNDEAMLQARLNNFLTYGDPESYMRLLQLYNQAAYHNFQSIVSWHTHGKANDVIDNLPKKSVNYGSSTRYLPEYLKR